MVLGGVRVGAEEKGPGAATPDPQVGSRKRDPQAIGMVLSRSDGSVQRNRTQRVRTWKSFGSDHAAIAWVCSWFVGRATAARRTAVRRVVRGDICFVAGRPAVATSVARRGDSITVIGSARIAPAGASWWRAVARA